MKDREGVTFLQWALPKLNMRWTGFRKVRRQVLRRINGRVRELGLAGPDAYRAFLDRHPEEWQILDAMCHVTISRFYRDRCVFGELEKLLTEIALERAQRKKKTLQCWSAGCASGEEAYTLLLIWELRLQARLPGLKMQIIATDSDPHMLHRAETGRYGTSSMKDLPEELLAGGFDRLGGELRLKDRFRNKVDFLEQDIRKTMPGGPFQVILCRNLVFTYFDETLQLRLLQGFRERLSPGGILVIGIHERLPASAEDFFAPDTVGIYRKIISRKN